MKRMTQKLIVELCKTNKLNDLQELKNRKLDLDKKSTTKDYFNLLERILLNLNENTNYETIDFIVEWCMETNVGFREEFIIRLFDRNNYVILDTINKYGLLDLNRKTNYNNSLYEKLLFKYINTIQFKNIIFLLRLGISPRIDVNKLIRLLEERENELKYMEGKIQEELEDFTFSDLVNILKGHY